LYRNVIQMDFDFFSDNLKICATELERKLQTSNEKCEKLLEEINSVQVILEFSDDIKMHLRYQFKASIDG